MIFVKICTLTPTFTLRLEFGNGFALEYKVVPYDAQRYMKTNGRIGPVFGTDGDVPHTRLDKLTFFEGKVKTSLEVSFMYDPWVERVDVNRFRIRSAGARRRILTGSFSDASGTTLPNG